jgi:hypothetical protein
VRGQARQLGETAIVELSGYNYVPDALSRFRNWSSWSETLQPCPRITAIEKTVNALPSEDLAAARNSDFVLSKGTIGPVHMCHMGRPASVVLSHIVRRYSAADLP